MKGITPTPISKAILKVKSLKQLLLFAIFILSTENFIYAQCSGGTSAGALATPTNTYQTSTFASIGLYKTFTAISGATYNFTFCNGGSASYDTQITILDNSGNAVPDGYNDDFCGLQSNLIWKATDNGTYRVLITQYNCLTSGATSATLAYALVEPQYYGGNRDGWSSAQIVSSPLSNIYSGGIKDGWSSSKISSAPLSNIYSGGTKDGWSTSGVSISAAPIVNTYSPADDAAGVAINSNLVLTFSEPIQKGTGNILIKVAGVTIQTIPASDASVTISGSTVTINPSVDYSSSASVNIEVSPGAFKDFSNNNYEGITDATTWNFTAADIIAPTLSSIVPADNATGILVNANLVMTFSESVQKGTGNILIKENGVTIQTIAVTNAIVTISGNTVTIDPADFGSSAAVNIEMAAGVIKDMAGNNFAGVTNSTTWNFSVVDITPPAISTLSPADNATNVVVNENLVMTFNESVQKGVGNILIKEGGVTTQTVSVADAIVTVSGNTVTIDPFDFTSSAGVNIEMAAGVIKDLAGNNFAGVTNATAWNFTVVDTTPPVVSTLSPTDNATNVAVNANLVITFNESVQKGIGNILIKEGGVTTQTISVADANVTVSGNSITIDPSDFTSSAAVNIEMAAGVIKDLTGNNFAGVTNATAWNFTVVDTTPPVVSTLSPTDNATNVAVNANVAITFNESVQKGIGNILIKESGITTQTIPITNANITISGNTVTIDPSDFGSSAAVNIEMAAGVIKDLAGNSFAGITNATAWNFTTSIPLQITNEIFVSTFNKGETLTVSISVNDATKVSKVNFISRGISESTTSSKSVEVSASGNKFEKIVSAPDLTDRIGLHYYFEVVDQTQAIFPSSKGKAYVKYLSTSTEQEIPNLRFGKLASDYQIISIPLLLSSPSVSQVFKSLMPYDSTKWRLFDYASNKNREYNKFSNIDIGKGYWLISRNSVTINPGEGTAAIVDTTTPFTIQLEPGWNLIGNPYNFSISWTEVLAASGNPSGVKNALTLFNSGILSDGTILNRYRGGFIKNETTSTIQLKVPVLRNTSLSGDRTSSEEVNLNSREWEIPISVSNGLLTNERGGIGMHPKASLTKGDKFDRESVPLIEGLDMPELIFSMLNSKEELTKEVVPTQNNFTWLFTVNPGTDVPLKLQWPIIKPDDNKKLILLDPMNQQMIDMTQETETIILPSGNSRKIIFGEPDYVTQILDKELPAIGSPYPNPAREEVKIPIYISESLNHARINIRVYNSTGSEVATLVDDYFEKGSHELTWKPMVESGMYFIIMQVGEGEMKRIKMIIY